MALHTKTEFAAMCGLQLRELSTYIGRNKVLTSGSYIDDSVPENFAFREKWASIRLGIEPTNAVPKGPKEVGVIAPVNRPKRILKVPDVGEPKTKTPTEFTYQAPTNQLDLKIREVELARKEEELEISKLKRQKMAGEVIPVDLVLLTLIQYGKSTTTSFENAADNFLVDIHKEAGLNNEQMAKMRKNLITIINEAVRESIEEAQSAIDNIVAEFSDTRGQGERIS